MSQPAPSSIQRIIDLSNNAALRVLVVASQFPSDDNPNAGIFNVNELSNLASLAEVQVVTPRAWAPRLKRNPLAPAQGVKAQLQYSGLNIQSRRYLRLPSFARRWEDKLCSVALHGTLMQTIYDQRPQVLFAASAWPDAPLLQRAAERFSIPLIVKCCGPELAAARNDARQWGTLLDIFHNSAAIVATSEYLSRMLIRNGIPRERIHVVYNGIDRHLFRPLPRGEARQSLRLSTHGKLLLCIGAMEAGKGHDDLLLAFKLLLRNYQIEARLALLGDGPLRSRLQAYAKTLKIARFVHFARGCRHESVPLWINASDTVCLPSHIANLPNTVFETLACGRPVVATRAGGMSELISSADYGELVPCGNPQALAQSLWNVLGRSWQPLLLSNSPKLGSWHTHAHNLLEVLQRVAA